MYRQNPQGRGPGRGIKTATQAGGLTNPMAKQRLMANQLRGMGGSGPAPTPSPVMPGPSPTPMPYPGMPSPMEYSLQGMPTAGGGMSALPGPDGTFQPVSGPIGDLASPQPMPTGMPGLLPQQTMNRGGQTLPGQAQGRPPMAPPQGPAQPGGQMPPMPPAMPTYPSRPAPPSQPQQGFGRLPQAGNAGPIRR